MNRSSYGRSSFQAARGLAIIRPSDIANLELWLDAGDASTITETGGAVSQWDDKSGNAHHVSQATAGAEPTTGTRTQNGRNVLDFDGGDSLVGSLTLAQPLTMLAVFARDADSTTRVLTSGGTAVQFGGGLNTSGSLSSDGAFVYGASAFLVGGTEPPAGVFGVAVGVLNGVDSFARFNGVSGTPGGPGNGGSAARWKSRRARACSTSTAPSRRSSFSAPRSASTTSAT